MFYISCGGICLKNLKSLMLWPFHYRNSNKPKDHYEHNYGPLMKIIKSTVSDSQLFHKSLTISPRQSCEHEIREVVCDYLGTIIVKY